MLAALPWRVTYTTDRPSFVLLLTTTAATDLAACQGCVPSSTTLNVVNPPFEFHKSYNAH
jgi:hypothetical protein